MLNDIDVPSLDVPDLDASSFTRNESKDLFAEKRGAPWTAAQQAEARCGFAPNGANFIPQSSVRHYVALEKVALWPDAYRHQEQ